MMVKRVMKCWNIETSSDLEEKLKSESQAWLNERDEIQQKHGQEMAKAVLEIETKSEEECEQPRRILFECSPTRHRNFEI